MLANKRHQTDVKYGHSIPVLKKKLMFIYFWQREREGESISRGGAEREGDTESEAGSRLWPVSTEPDVGLELTDCEIMTWAKVGCLTDWATQAPLAAYFFWFSTLNISCHSFPDCRVFVDRSAANLICLPLQVKDFFSLATFVILSLPVCFANLTMICLVDGWFCWI